MSINSATFHSFPVMLHSVVLLAIFCEVFPEQYLCHKLCGPSALCEIPGFAGQKICPFVVSLGTMSRLGCGSQWVDFFRSKLNFDLQLNCLLCLPPSVTGEVY